MTSEPSVDFEVPGIEDLVQIGVRNTGPFYRGRQVAADRYVTVQVLRDLSLEKREVLAETLPILETLSVHPNVACFYEYGKISRRVYYLLTEYLPEGTYVDRLLVTRALHWEEAVDIVVRVAGALSTAHSLGIVHGAVWLGNIFLSLSGEPVLTDFGFTGIAALSSNELAYAAPETLAQQGLFSPAADQYALGASLSVLLLGESAFTGPGSDAGTYKEHIFPNTSAMPYVEGVPAHIWRVVERSMSEDPEMRYPDIFEMGRELQAVQEEAGQEPSPLRTGAVVFPTGVAEKKEKKPFDAVFAQVMEKPVFLAVFFAVLLGFFFYWWWDKSENSVPAGRVLPIAGSEREQGLVWQRVMKDAAVFGGPSGQVARAVTQVGERLVIAGGELSLEDGDRDGVLWVSDDQGTTWQRLSHDKSLFGGPGWLEVSSLLVMGSETEQRLVAGGSEQPHDGLDMDGVIWLSDDQGTTWKRAPGVEALGGPDSQTIRALVLVDGRLLAVGAEQADAETRAAVWVSDDRGETWRRVAHDEAVFGGAGAQAMEGAVTVGTRVIGVGVDQGGDGAAAVWVSDDWGETWRRVGQQSAVFSPKGGAMLKTIIVLEGRLVAAGHAGEFESADAAVWVSDDRGDTWEQAPDDGKELGGVGAQSVNSLAVLGGRVVGAGSDRAFLESDTDLAVWTSG